ncbi:hypothetical protein CC80DRAFT_142810 [Byssothecium circinans]|uniref:Uncharacterized protein n=1 Tax=Byssothecium circinans TaxID=147558 RepID=A0A6A5TPJ8_9PLEO|nr:hypothetical protein CC80DRAFT_142810 [Byssothecium circinans]
MFSITYLCLREWTCGWVALNIGTALLFSVNGAGLRTLELVCDTTYVVAVLLFLSISVSRHG